MRSRRSITAAALALLVAAALAVLAAGCGDDEAPASSGGGNAATGGGASADGGATVKVAADESYGLAFVPAKLKAPAGRVTITMDNPDGNQMPHAVSIEGNGVHEEGQPVQPGKTATIAVDLKAGTYTFYCPVGQHRQNGMEGKLTVE